MGVIENKSQIRGSHVRRGNPSRYDWIGYHWFTR